MASRYYFAPVDPGWAQLGAGIGAGLEGGVAGFLGMQQRQADERRRRELDTLARRHAGWEEGDAPVTERTVFMPSFTAMPDIADPRQPTPEPRFGTGWMAPPAFEREPLPDRFRVQERDPRYQTITIDGRPERRLSPAAQAEAEFERQQAAAAGERERIRSVFSAALGALRTDLQPTQVGAMADIAAEMGGGGGADFVEPTPARPPVRGTPAYEAMLEREAAARRRGAPPVAGAGSPNTQRLEREETRRRAEAYAETLFREGDPATTVSAAAQIIRAQFPSLRREDVSAIASQAQQRVQGQRRAELATRRAQLIQRYGQPFEPLHHDILDELAEGGTPLTVINGLTAVGAPPEIIAQAKAFLRIP